MENMRNSRDFPLRVHTWNQTFKRQSIYREEKDSLKIRSKQEQYGKNGDNGKDMTFEEILGPSHFLPTPGWAGKIIFTLNQSCFTIY